MLQPLCFSARSMSALPAWAFALLLSISASFLPTSGLTAFAQGVTPLPPVTARNWLLLDLQSQQIIASKGADERIEPASLTSEFVHFIENNVKSNPGKSSLKFKIKEPQENLEVVLNTTDKGFTMNEEMAAFLMDNPDVEVSVGLFN